MRREDVKVILAIIGFYVVIELFGVTCPIRYITGISCAGCGMSRAWLSLLHLDILSAYYYHPLFWLPVPMAALFLMRDKIPEKLFRRGLFSGCALFLAVYIIRILNSADVIVTADLTQGIVYRSLYKIICWGQMVF